MGKKKGGSQHATESFRDLVSKESLARLKPFIVDMVSEATSKLGNRLSHIIVEQTEDTYARIRLLESIVMEKLGYTKDDLANMLADMEDARSGLAPADLVQVGDVVSIEIKTKTEKLPEYTPSKRFRIQEAGTGQTLGNQIESGLIGMKKGEEKEIKFGPNQENTAMVRVDRIARAIAQPDAAPAAEAQNAANA